MLKPGFPISNTDDIFVYLQIIKQTDSGSILDIGLFLKRIGAISRNIRGESIPDDAFLYGIDPCPEIEMAVFYTIYNGICHVSAISDMADKHFDLAIMLRPEGIFTKEQIEKCYDFISSHSKKLLINSSQKNDIGRFVSGKITEYSSGADSYCLIHIK